MRLLYAVAAAAILAAPALAKPMSPLQRENAIWQTVKDKNLKAFAGMLSPNLVAVYDDGIHSRDRELEMLRGQTLRSFKISNFNSRMIDAGEDMLTTYTVDVDGTDGKTNFSGRYHAASVWHRSGNNWLGVFHTEVKAK